MLISNPDLYLKIFLEKKLIDKTLKAGMLNYDDYEPGVEANVMMYLGKQTPDSIVKKLIADWNNGKFPMQYYNKKIVVAYHISRAYKKEIKELGKIKDSVVILINDEYESYTTPELLLAIIVLNNFNEKDSLSVAIRKRILNQLAPDAPEWENYSYFNSKDNVFNAGSSALTASWFLEASNNW